MIQLKDDILREIVAVYLQTRWGLPGVNRDDIKFFPDDPKLPAKVEVFYDYVTDPDTRDPWSREHEPLQVHAKAAGGTNKHENFFAMLYVGEDLQSAMDRHILYCENSHPCFRICDMPPYPYPESEEASGSLATPTTAQNAQLAPAKRAYTIDEVCALVSLGRTRLYEEIGAGRLRVRKVGRKSLILAQDVDAWLENLADYEDYSSE